MNENIIIELEKQKKIDIMVDNLPIIRARLLLTQSNLADMICFGRQSYIYLESKKTKMRWDTLVLLVNIFSNYKILDELLFFLKLDIKSINDIICSDIEKLIIEKNELKISMIWTDTDKKEFLRELCDLPKGLQSSCCLKCGSKNLTGALINEHSDREDPNILCKDCGYWRD